MWVVQGDYGYGWEDVDASESEMEALSSKRAYDLNEPQYRHRIRYVEDESE